MLHIENNAVRANLFQGNFGLEKESLRITQEGFLSHTPHPFPGDAHIVRDFCENQTEINTPVLHSPREAVETLYACTRRIHQTLAELPQPELLWPFSNPPYIRNEADIPVARFSGGKASKTDYREYLSDRYGRYKMTFSGIHVNFSFGDGLLLADFKCSGETDFRAYKNRLYLTLAQQAAAYGWILTALTAASPLLDSSFLELGHIGETRFIGMASTRCSELGYWNFFTPILDYTDISAYTGSIRRYVTQGLIRAPSELYYPVRLKPRGNNDLDRLAREGVDHIELRMFDLNPLRPEGLELRDLEFAWLLLLFLAGTDAPSFPPSAQVQAAQNFKNAARFDLETVKIVCPEGEVLSAAEAGIQLIRKMRKFYANASEEILAVLGFEEQKLIHPEQRYAWKIRQQFADGFVSGGLRLATQYREKANYV